VKICLPKRKWWWWGSAGAGEWERKGYQRVNRIKVGVICTHEDSIMTPTKRREIIRENEHRNPLIILNYSNSKVKYFLENI
jgi:hypothetical protein